MTTGTCCARVIYTGQLRPPFNADGSCPVKDTKSEIIEISTVAGVGYRVVPKKKELPKEFLKNLNALKKKKITQRELAAKMGVTPQTVGRWVKIAKERML